MGSSLKPAELAEMALSGMGVWNRRLEWGGWMDSIIDGSLLVGVGIFMENTCFGKSRCLMLNKCITNLF